MHDASNRARRIPGVYPCFNACVSSDCAIAVKKSMPSRQRDTRRRACRPLRVSGRPTKLCRSTPGLGRDIGGDKASMQYLHADQMIDDGVELRLGGGGGLG